MQLVAKSFVGVKRGLLLSRIDISSRLLLLLRLHRQKSLLSLSLHEEMRL
jgi:hypothetical protein